MFTKQIIWKNIPLALIGSALTQNTGTKLQIELKRHWQIVIKFAFEVSPSFSSRDKENYPGLRLL